MRIRRHHRSRAYKNITVAVLALLLYEYFITFDREIGIAWSHKLSWGKAIFLFSRYIGLLLVLQGFAFEFLPGPIFVCAFLAHFSNIVKIAQYAACASFSGLRAYTVSGSNKIITSLVVILAAVPPVVTTIVFEITNVDHLQSIDPLSIRLCTADMALDKMEYFSRPAGLVPRPGVRTHGRRDDRVIFMACISGRRPAPILDAVALTGRAALLHRVQWSHRRRTALQDASSLLSGV
ncbi:hypothetical protein C8Q76DRAFT_104410 [Earliella scabrosa]|nr:hypothetical protein C8Q76DRAFT_104410 [Earliella scabrosa]